MRILRALVWFVAALMAALIGRAIGLHMYFWGWGALALLAISTAILMLARNTFDGEHYDPQRFFVLGAMWLAACAAWLDPLIQPLLH